MRILFSAYACAPRRGSEPGVGWNWVQQVSRDHHVWVLVPENHREAIESFVSQEPANPVHFVFCDLPESIRPSNRDTTVRFALHCYLWQFVAWRVARELHRRYSFDLAHHITLGAYWKPGLLALLPVPFIVGPVGGGEAMPHGFWGFISWKGRLFESARLLAQRIAELDPLVRLTVRRSVLAIAKTPETRERLAALGGRRTLVMSEAGLPAEELEWLSAMPLRKEKPFRLLSLGRLLDWKGFELSVRAFAIHHGTSPESEYWLVGDGPARQRLTHLAKELGVAGKIRFWGELPRHEAIAKIAECDVLVHPSLHDSGGWVCLEAMCAARPVVCLDLGGPGVQVTASTGMKITVGTPSQVVDDLAKSFQMLSADEDLREWMGKTGRKRVNEKYAWDHRREELLALYSSLKGMDDSTTVRLPDVLQETAGPEYSK